MTRHQPRATSMVDGSLILALDRSAADLRAEERRQAFPGQSCFWAVLALPEGGTVMVTWAQYAGGISGGKRISGRVRERVPVQGLLRAGRPELLPELVPYVVSFLKALRIRRG